MGRNPSMCRDLVKYGTQDLVKGAIYYYIKVFYYLKVLLLSRARCIDVLSFSTQRRKGGW